MFKLSWHIQGPRISRELIDIINEARPAYVKIVDPPSGESPFAEGIRVIGRAFIGDRNEAELIKLEGLGADRYCKILKGFYDTRRYVFAWEGPNEPSVKDTPFDLSGKNAGRSRLNTFLVRWARNMHDEGRLVVLPSLSVGWPAKPEDMLDLRQALEAADFWSVHEYSAPTMHYGEGYLCLRYRSTIEYLRKRGVLIKPLFITECGIDGGVIGRPGDGWKEFLLREEYARQLEWYAKQLGHDDYVICGFVFTSEPIGWESFEVDLALSRWMASKIRQAGASPQPPPATSDMVVLAEKIRWWQEEALRVLQAGDWQGGMDILHDNIERSYRLERILKEGKG